MSLTYFPKSIASRKCVRANPIAGAIPAVAEIVKCRATDRLVRACRAVLPCAERRPANRVRRATQSRRGTGVEVGVPHAVARRAGTITKIVKLGVTDGLT